MNQNNNLSKHELPFSAILLDMDGVLFHGMNPIEGAMEFMQSIAHIPHIFVTNNPIRLPESMADKMAEIGFERPDDKLIITSGEATAAWLAQQKPEFSFFAIGAGGLHQSLQKYGYEDKTNADFVVVGEGEGLDYAALTTGINLIVKKSAQLICTNPDTSVDAFYRGKRAILPGAGALVAPFIVATGMEPITIGKPKPLLYEIAMQELNVQASNCLMIGDRPDTDILGAQYLDIKTALVRTGRFAPGERLPEGMSPPDWDVDNLVQLKKLLGL
ncbi:MAG: HAD-IIA family hydrolase [Gammaproteobacteria bacterium]|nr:HAD-IIA family hydrolase [Gammaproteobacteria bacterium]